MPLSGESREILHSAQRGCAVSCWSAECPTHRRTGVIEQGPGTFAGTKWICTRTGCDQLIVLHINPSFLPSFETNNTPVDMLLKIDSPASSAISISLFCSLGTSCRWSLKRAGPSGAQASGRADGLFFLFPFCNPFWSCLPVFWLVFYGEEDETHIPDRHKFFYSKFPFNCPLHIFFVKHGFQSATPQRSNGRSKLLLRFSEGFGFGGFF